MRKDGCGEVICMFFPHTFGELYSRFGLASVGIVPNHRARVGYNSH